MKRVAVKTADGAFYWIPARDRTPVTAIRLVCASVGLESADLEISPLIGWQLAASDEVVSVDSPFRYCWIRGFLSNGREVSGAIHEQLTQIVSAAAVRGDRESLRHLDAASRRLGVLPIEIVRHCEICSNAPTPELAAKILDLTRAGAHQRLKAEFARSSPSEDSAEIQRVAARWRSWALRMDFPLSEEERRLAEDERDRAERHTEAKQERRAAEKLAREATSVREAQARQRREEKRNEARRRAAEELAREATSVREAQARQRRELKRNEARRRAAEEAELDRLERAKRCETVRARRRRQQQRVDAQLKRQERRRAERKARVERQRRAIEAEEKMLIKPALSRWQSRYEGKFQVSARIHDAVLELARASKIRIPPNKQPRATDRCVPGSFVLDLSKLKAFEAHGNFSSSLRIVANATRELIWWGRIQAQGDDGKLLEVTREIDPPFAAMIDTFRRILQVTGRAAPFSGALVAYGQLNRLPLPELIATITLILETGDHEAIQTLGSRLKRRQPLHPLVKRCEVAASSGKARAGADWAGMSGLDFERAIADAIRSSGLNVEETPGSGDYGADLIVMTASGTRAVIQAKRWRNRANLKSVQEVAAAVSHYKADFGIVASVSGYFKSAVELARSNDVELWCRTELDRILAGDLSFSRLME